MGRDAALERAWRERMRRYEGSGLTIRQFCEQEGLVDHQFSWWRGELKRRTSKSASTSKRSKKTKKPVRTKKTAKSPKPSAASFVPVQVEASPLAPASVEVVLDRPPRIRVAAGFDAELLREVVRVLEQH